MKSSSIPYTVTVVIGLLSLVESSVLQRVYSQYGQQKTCSIMDFPGVIDDCDVIVMNGQFPTGSQCRMVELDVGTTYEVNCIDGQWIKLNSVSGPFEHRQKRFLGFVAAAVGIVVACVIFCGGGGGGGGNTKAVEVNKDPSFTNCPTISGNIVADRGSNTAIVTWDDPTGTDPDGDEVTVSQTGGDLSGSVFHEGKHYIVYKVKDTHDNKDFCFMEFTVEVLRCDQLEWPKNGYKYCDGADNWGSRCTFTCDDGYEIEGASSVTCESDGYYSTSAPTCSRVKCATPEEPTHGTAVCSRPDYRFGSICLTHCNYGYTAAMFGFSECMENEQWSNSLSTCQDVQPPRLTCPGVIKGYTYWNSNTAHVTWDDPIATDNSGDVVVELLDTNFAPGSLFPVGYTPVTYQAIDGAGNTSPTCTVMVIVETISCPPPALKDDYLVIDCHSNGLYQWGSSCSLSCMAGLPQIGPDTITCERVNDTAHAKWVWDWEEEPYCEQTICPHLDPPLNGALACERTIQLEVCNLMCNDEFDISPRVVDDTLIVCGSSKTWTPLNVPDCSVKRNPENMNLPSEIYYYSGACGDEAANNEILNDFLDRINELQQSAKWTGVCEELSCDIENVDIYCGTTDRKKRDAKQITKKNAEATYIISFFITVNIGEITINGDIIDSTEIALLDLANIMDGTVKSGAFNISGLEVREDSFASEAYTGWGCPYGQVTEMTKFYDAFCVGCPVGTYYDGQNDCLSCPKGTYRDTEDTPNCTVCPEGTWTSKNGSVNASQCIDVCAAGTYSLTGLSPCSPCPAGEYQFETMAQNCSVCPLGTTTETESSKALSDCLDFDMLLHRSGKIHVDNLPDAEVTDVTVMVWLYWMVSFGYMDISLGHHMLINYTAHSVHISIRDESIDTTMIPLTEQWTHVAVRISLTPGNAAVFVNGEIVDVENTFPSLFENISLSDMELLYRGPEKTGIQISGFNVITSPLTDSDIRVMSMSCNMFEPNAHVTMSDLSRGSNSNADLVIPTHCDEYDDCKDQPCGSHVCENVQNGYICYCSGGFAGDNCEIPPDYCVDNKCQNSATCVSAGGNYTCNCLPGYSGEMCQTAPVNGQLGTWTDWSVCSVTCGGGTRTRERECNSPPPDEYGAPCQGHTYEYEECNVHVCPSCTKLERPYASLLRCDDTGGMTYCNLTCRDGYTFPPGHEPKQLYYCGIETNYEWQHTTNDNPLGDLPGCSKIGSPNGLSTRTQVTYKDFPCGKEDDAKKKLTENLEGLQCVNNATCTMDVAITGCEFAKRKRRQIGTAALFLSLTVLIDDGELALSAFFENNTISETLAQILQAINELEMSAQALQNNSFLDILSDGTTFHADIDTLFTAPVVRCPIGSVAAEVFCVECTPGTFYDAGQCSLCERGTYQDDFGQSSCTQCPHPYTTPGKGSTSLLYCDSLKTTDTSQISTATYPQTTSVEQTEEEEDSVLEIALLSLCGFISGVVLVFVLYGIRYLIRKRSREEATGSYASLGMVRPANAYSSSWSRDSSEHDRGNPPSYEQACVKTLPKLGSVRSLSSNSGTIHPPSYCESTVSDLDGYPTPWPIGSAPGDDIHY